MERYLQSDKNYVRNRVCIPQQAAFNWRFASCDGATSVVNAARADGYHLLQADRGARRENRACTSLKTPKNRTQLVFLPFDSIVLAKYKGT